jgi:hypothetical protein
MANATTAFGFRPVKEPDPSSIITCIALSSYGTALYVGDAVVPAGSGDATTGYMSVARAAAGDTNVIGVIVGFEPTSPDSLTSKTGAASTTRYVKVVPAFQSTIFEVMANASIDVDGWGNRYDLVATAGSAATGYFSGMVLDVSSAATTGKTLVIVGAPQRADNDIAISGGTQTGTKVYVSFLESLWNNGPGV